jgi:hypothetical protein
MQKLHMDDIINSPLNKPQENVSAKVVLGMMNGGTPPIEPKATMKLHIDIRSYDKQGGVFQLEGDVYNQDDLAAIHERFKAHMPRRKLWGLL